MNERPPHFTVTWTRAATKGLRRAGHAKAEKIAATMAAIATEPFGRHPNVKPLEGVEDGFRLRVGGWRVQYRIERRTRVIEVFDVDTRGSAYLP